MKAARSNRSLASIKSTKSMRTVDGKKGDVGGEFLDFTTTLPMACAKLQFPYAIIVKKQQDQDEFYKSIKHGEATPRTRKKLSIMPTYAIVASELSVKTSDERKSVETEHTTEATDALTVTAFYDTYNCLTEILFNGMKVPRMLMQIIILIVPYFQNLSKLTVRRCHIDFYILHELSKILEISSITSLCVDNSPVLQGHYEVLLHEQSGLRNLSLCKCKLDDDDCKLLATKLRHGAPAENLQTLNLSSNHITDVGANYISDALRSNRRLRYLNLADNRINDEGAAYLLDILMEFLLTNNEIFDMRIRYMKYLKYKQALYVKYLNQCDRSCDELSQFSRKSAAKRKKSSRKDKDSRKLSDEDVRERAEMLVKEILGNFIDPFESNSIKHRNNQYYCIGNMVLCYLNLSYNNLSFLTVKKIQKVVMYQNITKTSNQSGLVKVVIDGNNLPMCKEMVLLNELFGRNIRNISGKAELVKRRRSRI